MRMRQSAIKIKRVCQCSVDRGSNGGKLAWPRPPWRPTFPRLHRRVTPELSPEGMSHEDAVRLPLHNARHRPAILHPLAHRACLRGCTTRRHAIAQPLAPTDGTMAVAAARRHVIPIENAAAHKGTSRSPEQCIAPTRPVDAAGGVDGADPFLVGSALTN